MRSNALQFRNTTVWNGLPVSNPPGRYCPFYLCVISTVPRFSASGGQTEDEGIEPLQVLPVPQLSRLVAIHLAASSLKAQQRTNPSTGARLEEGGRIELLRLLAAPRCSRPLAVHSAAPSLRVSDGNRTRYDWFHKPAPLPLWLQTP